MARRPRPSWSYRAARRNMARNDPAYPFVPQRPIAVHQFDRATWRSIVRAKQRAARGLDELIEAARTVDVWL